MLYNYNGDEIENNRWISEFSGEQNSSYNGPEFQPPKKKKKMGVKIAALALACLLAGGVGGGLASNWLTSGGAATITTGSRTATTVDTKSVSTGDVLTFPQIYAKYVDATVGISTESSQTNIFGQTTSVPSAGSGFIITEDGYIVTNYHVIEDANTVKVTLNDGKSYNATVVGYDSDADLAVLKISATGLTTVVIGDSSKTNVGESVAAVGNPLGELTFSMSAGIVSALGREINIDGNTYDVMQIDAAVNPGNSGGPLFNTYGEVIGIVSAKYADTEIEGLGFAIPINNVTNLIKEIMEKGYVSGKPSMGISVTTVSSDTASRYNLVEGAYVYTVESGSCAQKAGLKAGDIITKMDDTKITSVADLAAAKKAHKAGDTVKLTVYRNGSSIQLSLTFDEQKTTGSTTTTAGASSSTQNEAGSNTWSFGGSGMVPYSNSGSAA